MKSLVHTLLALSLSASAFAAEEKPAAQRIRQLSHTVQITRLPDWKQRAPRARKLVSGLEHNQPRILQAPESQLTLAALRRASGSAGDADLVLRRGLTAAEDNPQNEWAGVFRREDLLRRQHGNVYRRLATSSAAVPPT